jgi:hypothetical protein
MRKHLRSDQSGMALMTVLLVCMLASALMAGMFAAVMSDQRSLGFDRDQSQAYSAAHAGLEKLTTQLAQLFVTDFSPTATQIQTASSVPPTIYGFTFVAPGGGSGYNVSFNADLCSCPNKGNPLPSTSNDVTTGPFAGFKGLITPYTLTVTARSTGGGSEVRLRREVQTVAVPVFQFGVFGEKSLSFHAGNDMEFAGRVHTNGHLFLAAGGGTTTIFHDKLTAVGQVVRAELENTNPITSSGHTGTVRIPTVIGSSYRNLSASEGSVSGGPGSGAVSGWKNLSEVTYNTNVRNTLTGAKRLDLPLVSSNAFPIDLIQRPDLNSNEDTANRVVFLQRYFAQASLRILLSDRAADLTGLPTITGGAPTDLNGTTTTGLPLASAIGPATASTISGTASTYAAPYHQLNVTAVPDVMLIPNLVVGGNPVTCTGKTASTFTGCTLTTAITANVPVTAVLPSGLNVSTTVIAPYPSGTGGGKTLTVTANSTIPFANDFMWINDRTNNRPTPMTCEGYNTAVAPQRLLNCRILGITTAQTTSGRVISTHSLSPSATSQIGGFIKIERQDANNNWFDVTAEILGLGFAAPNQEGTICADPTPNAVIRIQRLRDNGGSCAYAGSVDYRDYWPNVLFDAREATYRDQATTAPMTMGGVMNYVAIDVANLKRWLNGTIGVTGTQALNNNGYIVYFSDRRGNHDDSQAGAPETGEYGNEDSVNSAAGSGSSVANGVLEGGEDRNESTTLETYGATPSAVALYGASAPFNNTSTPLTQIPATNAAQARVNRQVFFRRALKLVNGGINGGVNNLPDAGLTVATENGVYVQGNYNATSTDPEAEPNRPAAVIADSIVILSNSWTDARSLNSPNDRAGRPATNTGYRFAMIAGKSIPFPKPSWATLGNWGTDGGVHNFMRMLEDWGSATTYYRGSMVSLYTARQFIGMFKNNSNVYLQGDRDFAFDTDFLQPSLLPPGTPMFRDVNTLRFRQILRPNQ